MSAHVEAVLRQLDNARARIRYAPELTAEEADTLEHELHRLAEFVNTRRRTPKRRPPAIHISAPEPPPPTVIVVTDPRERLPRW